MGNMGSILWEMVPAAWKIFLFFSVARAADGIFIELKFWVWKFPSLNTSLLSSTLDIQVDGSVLSGSGASVAPGDPAFWRLLGPTCSFLEGFFLTEP